LVLFVFNSVSHVKLVGIRHAGHLRYRE